MLRKIKRVWNVMTKEGLKTFCYLIGSNLQAKKSAQWKYKQWRKVHERQKGILLPINHQPFFSIIMIGQMGEERTIRSVENQNYVNYEIIKASQEDSLGDMVHKAKGQYISFIHAGDCLAEEALCRLAVIMLENYNHGKLLFYSDEDVLAENGERKQPFFKSDYSPDTLRSFFYIGGFVAINTGFLKKLQFSLQKNMKHGAYLAVLEASFSIKEEQVCHVPEIFYHRNEKADRPDVTALAEDKKKLFEQYGIKIQTEIIEDCKEVRVVYDMEEQPKVSIIIPSKDNPPMLKVCLDSIEAYTEYDNYEIVVIDNGSSTDNKAAYEKLCQGQKVDCRYYYVPMEFNFSRMCNIGANHAKGEYYLFLNDDIEIRQHKGADWLSRLMGQAMQLHTGVVGAKLLYPNSNKIQHVGVVNYESGAAHILSKAEDDKPLLFGRNRMDYNYSVVTGACFLISSHKFHEAGGFEEKLAVTFNDVELCFRVMKKGYYNVLRNDVILYHHESISRGEDAVDPKKFLRHLKEREKLFRMHPEFVKRDPFYSKNLTQKELDGAINLERRPEEFPVVVNKPEPWMDDEELIVHIEFVRVEDKVYIGGFAFSENVKHNNSNKTYVMLKGQKEVAAVETMRIYNPTIAPQMESSKNLNFVEFYTAFPIAKLHEAAYGIGVQVVTASGKKILRKMTDTQLKISGNKQVSI